MRFEAHHSASAGPEHATDHLSALRLLAFACLLVAVKWMLIHAYGNPTPYWDQWDAEADHLYAPYLAGKLEWLSLFGAHNEHRILTTRLYALLLFVLNGQWNPLLQMAANAVLHAAILVYLLVLMKRVVPSIVSALALGVCLTLFCLPYAWENTLAGFQTQFYLNLFFSCAGLWFLITKPPLSWRWWWGCAMAVAAYFSFASGIFTCAAAAAILLLQCLRSHSPRRIQLIVGVSILCVLFIVGYLFIPILPNHAALKASSPAGFIKALCQSLSWPQKMSPLRAILINAPGLAFSYLLLRHRRVQATCPEWFLLGLLVWVFGQSVATAYGRAIAVLASRYLDLLAVGILANFACLLWFFARTGAHAGLRRGLQLALTCWVMLLATGMYTQWPGIVNELEHKRQVSITEQTNVEGFLRTEDPAYIEGKPFLDIPYPDAGRLMRLLSDPRVRSILPAAVVPPDVPDRREGRFDLVVDVMLAHAYILLIVGIFCVALDYLLRKQKSGTRALNRYKRETHE